MDSALTSQQLAVIGALTSGATITAAADEAGVHRNTINNWRRNLPSFQQAFTDAQYDRALYFREKMESLIDLAFQALQQILADPKTPPSVRLKAALAIITTASTPPKPNIHTPVNEDQPAPAPEVHNSAQSEPPIPPKSAQPTPTPRPQKAQPVPTKLGRNSPCPCGSGKKYKRCCLGDPVIQQLKSEIAQHILSAA